MKKAVSLILIIAIILLVFSGCGATPTSTESDTITMVWYPNESGEDLKGAREEIGKLIEEATGKTVEHQLTTDYVIAIEAIANGNAQMGFFGAQGYIEANTKNDKVQPLVVNSGSSGTLDDAVYYSWLNVKKGNEDAYKSGEEYAIDNIQGKKFSFVSNSSTSGFKVPSTSIAAYFSEMADWKDLTADDLMEGGTDKFFSEVLYGGSHQGSAVNLLTDKADVAAFCDVCVANYVELAEGTQNTPGAVYKVIEGAAEPFDTVVGAEFVSISVTPVLNAPFVINTEYIDEETIQALRDVFTNEKVTNNESVFIPEDSETKGLWKQGERFLEVSDDWFNPIRELSK
ncbi:MAG: PhnD/SsuA/transferrin family substrate-binding protein [Eubacteriales bacterium]